MRICSHNTDCEVLSHDGFDSSSDDVLIKSLIYVANLCMEYSNNLEASPRTIRFRRVHDTCNLKSSISGNERWPAPPGRCAIAAWRARRWPMASTRNCSRTQGARCPLAPRSSCRSLAFRPAAAAAPPASPRPCRRGEVSSMSRGKFP